MTSISLNDEVPHFLDAIMEVQLNDLGSCAGHSNSVVLGYTVYLQQIEETGSSETPGG